jgi:hypothetical protein
MNMNVLVFTAFTGIMVYLFFQWGEHLICCFHKPCFYCRRQCNKHKFVKFSKESRQIKNF